MNQVGFRLNILSLWYPEGKTIIIYQNILQPDTLVSEYGQQGDVFKHERSLKIQHPCTPLHQNHTKHKPKNTEEHMLLVNEIQEMMEK